MIKIREMNKKDIQAVKATVKTAFYREGKDEKFNEWEFAEQVIKDKDYVKELCRIALIDEEVVGYILLTKAQIGMKQGLSLGPLAVSPTYQNMGIGKQLVNEGILQAKSLGYKWIALTGGDYYFQFGFEPALQHNIILSENNPENEYLKICFLNKNIEKDVCGVMKFCDSFYNEKGELL
ncbi:MAG: GCN5-related N-acetyltransferase [Clostridiales bacterium]|jgi:predicted N-acetyltransferase YhbS|nr:GCN5-related N-acetyltransferase [Clostridiales bacterium]